MLFAYKGITDRRKSGYVYAENKKEAMRLLKEDGVVAIYYLEEKFSHPTLDKVREYVSEEKDKRVVIRHEKEMEKKERKEGREGKEGKKEKRQIQLPSREKLATFIDNNMRKRPTEIKIDKEMYQELAKLFNSDEVQEPSYASSGFEMASEHSFETKRSFSKGVIDWDLVDETSKNIDTEKLKIKRKEVIMFTKRLKMMISSGIELPRALGLLHDNPNKNIQTMVEGILKQVQDGQSLKTAMSKYPNQFDSTYITLIGIGEQSGTLTDVLESLVEHMSKKERISKTVKNASIYPIIVMTVLIIALTIGSVFLLPMFLEIFEDMAGDDMVLPTITRIVFGIAGMLPQLMIGTVISFVIIAFLRSKITNIDRFFKKRIDKFLIKMPVVKDIAMMSYMYMISSTIGLMTSSGINVNSAVSAVRGTVSNVYIKNDLGRIFYLMESESFAFSDALREQDNIDQLLTSMALTGEESGAMSEVLKDASEYYDEELNAMVANAMEILPQASMLLMAIIAIPVVFAIFLPILDVQTAMPM